MTDDLCSKAIGAALKSNWKEAICLNLTILSKDKTNTDALNRLAYAYLQNGNPKKAKSIYRQVINLDPYNEIAKKNLVKINALKKGTRVKNNNKDFSGTNNNAIFIEEPGKTKCVTLLKTAIPSVLSCLCPGEEVRLSPKRHSTIVVSQNGIYLGALPDDIGYKISKRQKGGNKYQACVKFASKNSLSIFIKETFRAKRFRDQPTFVTSSPTDYYASVREDGTIGDYQKTTDTISDNGDNPAQEDAGE